MCAMRGFSVRRFGFVSRQPSGRFCCVGVGDCSVAAAFHEVPPVKKRMVTCIYFTYCREGGGELCCLSKSRFLNDLGEVILDVKFEK